MDENADCSLVAILLTLGRTVVLDCDADLNLAGVHNRLLLDEWRESVLRAGRERPATLRALFEELMAPTRCRDLLCQIGAGVAAAGQADLYLGVAALHAPRGGAPERHVALSLHQGAATAGCRRLVMRDVTALTDVQHHLGETQSALDAAMAALRAPPQDLRMFLGSALTSVSAIRATLRTPARDQEALHDKLSRLHASVAQLGKEAETLNLRPVQDACQALLNRLTAMLECEQLTGDALLPLATLVDRIAGSAGILWRVEEQRYVEPEAARTPSRAGRQPDWTFATERRWSSFLRQRGQEIGVLVNLEIEGTAHVPRHLRSGIDELLQHMLRNAVEHGIETPEERLAAQKPAAGKVLVKFALQGDSLLRMSVRDDGRGRGLGLTFLRKAVARLGGQISVAARPDQCTEFVIDLPHGAQSQLSSAAL